VDDAEGLYDLAIYGPNGFHRAVTGRATPEAAGADVEVAYAGQGQLLRLTLRNGAEGPRTFVVTARAYADATPTRVEVARHSRETVELDVSASGRWYDYEIRVDADADFLRRVAGRIENGEPSVSDPAMGMG
jgi:phospholipase C